jgi:hypothetical protein
MVQLGEQRFLALRNMDAKAIHTGGSLDSNERSVLLCFDDIAYGN